jgi:hypothetical protein
MSQTTTATRDGRTRSARMPQPECAPRSARVALTFGLLAATALAGCGQDDATPAPVDSFCTEGEQRCFQNALLTCKDQGKAWKVAGCGGSKSCGTGNAGVGCQSLVCARSSLSCDDKKVLKCPDDGLSDPTPIATCKTNELCSFGVCVPSACTDGDKRCGWNATLECKGGSWKSQKCAAGERCDAGACVAQACAPTTIECESDTRRRTCKNDGSGWESAACAAGEQCDDGVCHPKVKGAAPKDAGGGGGDASVADAGGDSGGGFIDIAKDEFVFEPLDVMTLYQSKSEPIPEGTQPVEFEFVSATWLSGGQTLQISGDKDLHKLEITVAPVEEYTTGSFSDFGREAPSSAITMNDGTLGGTDSQWRYQALEYSISITEFGDIGGRVKGNYKATLGDALDGGKTTIYVEGSFDVKRTQ